MVSGLRRAWQEEQLSRITHDDVDALLDELMAKEWVVYSKATLQHANTVVKYLSRYTHKIAHQNPQTPPKLAGKLQIPLDSHRPKQYNPL
jgi:hypothetical protein